MPDCGCTNEKPCACEGCQEKDALVRQLYHKIADLDARLKDAIELDAKATRH